MALPRPRDQQHIFSLVEQATHLLRRAPLSTWLTYYAGSAPFVVYLFYFWSDMSRSASAHHHLLESSLILAVLYWWMKVWQAVYCSQLLREMEGRSDAPPMSRRGWMRLVSSQAWIHATMPWMLTLAAVALFPLGWTYAFYHNVSVLAMEHYRDGGRTKGLLNQALGQSHYRPLQNHVLQAILVVLSILVYLNIFAGFFNIAMLSKSFTGVENEFSRDPWLWLSTPVQALLIGCSYLVMGPLVKALFVLRCFYGQARKTGADLQVQLRSLTLRMQRSVSLLLIFITLMAGPAALAAESKGAAGMPSRAPELKRSIKEVLSRSEFQWRFPREKGSANEETSWLGAIVGDIVDWFRKMASAVARFIGKLLDQLFGGSHQPTSQESGPSTFVTLLPDILIALLIVIVVLFAIILYRNWSKMKKPAPAVAAPAVAAINLENEQIMASQLPEDEWLQMAREKMAAGEYRLALRALFLATLAHLGEKRLIQISRTKSNGDYLREIGWRARDRTDLAEGFSEEVRIFDRSWYGWHEVTAGVLDHFRAQHERIVSHAP